ncbi:MAG: NUDIX domain-containing protein [Acidimicrobiia bacterium]
MPEARRTPVLAVGAVAQRDRELLVIRRGHGPGAGQWSIPGGRVEFGEDVREALVREVAEETGLEVVVERFLGWVERIDGPRSHFVILDFVVDVLDPAQSPVAGCDASEAAWVPFDDLVELPVVDGLLDFLADHGVLAPDIDIDLRQ